MLRSTIGGLPKLSNSPCVMAAERSGVQPVVEKVIIETGEPVDDFAGAIADVSADAFAGRAVAEGSPAVESSLGYAKVGRDLVHVPEWVRIRNGGRRCLHPLARPHRSCEELAKQIPFLVLARL